MKLPATAPIIGVPMCIRLLGNQNYHIVGDKYLRAVIEASACYPLAFPALGNVIEIDALLDRLDGILFTGSTSNVAVHHYQGEPDRPESPQDPGRDAITLPLIRRAIARELPIFCICRGAQELNVALGGTLHTQLHVKPGNLDHREPPEVSYDEAYRPAHAITLRPGGPFAQIIGKTEIMVNSLHWQGVEKLAPQLVAEGTAPDGVIEAMSIRDYGNFGLAAQWHPEYQATENPDSRSLFAAFGKAAHEYRNRREGRR
ncbi:MAG TPA: gamma-glutamyl-gamma-aminobutyrate hydrolase family protein [Dongiaceae bacterium]|jgi:putative glutamine amidotransferase|nr:gamma-glutamyl-gamma-aminobutyrate hydrolase family protein [Dongiaceae bacterium]